MEGWPARREWGKEGGLLHRVTAEGKGGRLGEGGGREGGKGRRNAFIKRGKGKQRIF